MHTLAPPKIMQTKTSVYKDVIKDIQKYFRNRVRQLDKYNISHKKIWLDPGIGFGKTVDHNFSLIQHLGEICDLGYPVLIGPSRKSFIGSTLDLPAEERIEGTAASVCAGILHGARIVRVHDVMEMKRVVAITEKIRTAA